MSLGLEWKEDIPYNSPDNAEIAMEFAPDRYRYVLERPIEGPPGVKWAYCGGATALLGHLISRGTGLPLPEFAREVLFGPLGIHDFEWMAGPDGVASPASGLRLATRDLARIGELVLAGGQWEGREVVPAGWIRTMLEQWRTPAVLLDEVILPAFDRRNTLCRTHSPPGGDAFGQGDGGQVGVGGRDLGHDRGIGHP